MGLLPLYHAMVLAYYRLALSQIDVLHPDVPHIVRRIAELDALEARHAA